MVPHNNKRINKTWHKQLTQNKCYTQSSEYKKIQIHKENTKGI